MISRDISVSKVVNSQIRYVSPCIDAISAAVAICPWDYSVSKIISNDIAEYHLKPETRSDDDGEASVV